MTRRRLTLVLASFAAAAVAVFADAPGWVCWPLITVMVAAEVWWVAGLAKRTRAGGRAGGSR